MSMTHPVHEGLPRLAVTGITGLAGQALLQELERRRDARVYVVEADEVEEHFLEEGHVTEQLLPDEMDWASCSALLVASPELPAWADNLPCPVIRLWPQSGLAAALCQALQPLIAALPKVSAAQLTVLWPIAVKQQPGIEELVQQTASLLNGRGATPRLFAQQVAFNLSLGKLDLAPELGQELRGLFAPASCTVVEALAPSFFAVAVAMHLSLPQAADEARWRKALTAAGVKLASGRKDLLSLVSDVSGQEGWQAAAINADGTQISWWLCGDLARTLLVEPALRQWRQILAA